MNRYQQEVAEMDARHHWRVRAISLLGAVALAVFVLWAADFRVGNFDLAGGWWQQDTVSEKDKPLAKLVMPDSNSPARDVTNSMSGTESSISEVPLPLILARTEPGPNERESRAYLGVARANPQTYAGGAILANGARLKEIHADHVVIERDGTSVRLYIDGSKQNSKTTNELLMVGGQSKAMLAEAISHELLTDYIRPSPVYDGELLKGYEVYAGQRSEVFSQMGLQNGDVVLAINDMPFTDPQQAISMFNQLTTGIAVVGNVERKGSVERINLDGALITADQERIKNPPSLSQMPLGPAM